MLMIIRKVDGLCVQDVRDGLASSTHAMPIDKYIYHLDT